MKEFDICMHYLLAGNEVRSKDSEINELVSEKRAYGHFLLNCKKHFTNKVSTAGVSITDQMNLYINPEFFKSLNIYQRIDLLIHECLHLVNYHQERAKMLGIEGKNIMTEGHNFNIAADAAINGPLKHLHEMGVTVDKLAEQLGLKLKSGQTAEYYYKHIKDFIKENPDKCQQMQNMSTIDDHSTWEESEGYSEEYGKEILKKALKDSVEKAGGVGNSPGEFNQALENLCKSTVNWKQQLKRFFAKSDKFSKERTRMKRNRRYGFLVSGKRKKPDLFLVIAIDTSGSVSDKELQQFFAEIDKMYIPGMQIKIIEADYDIQQIYDYEPKMKIEVAGRGGTAYNPAILKAIELKPDGLIYFGDGEIWREELTKPKFPVLWAITRDNPKPVEWGGYCPVKLSEEQ